MSFISTSYQSRKLYKRYGLFLVYGSLIVSFLWFLVAPISCNLPKTYSIGNIDERFGYSERDLLEKAKEAEQIWENGIGLDILEFDPEDGLSINLIFDERQRRTNEIEVANITLENLEDQRQSVQERFESLNQAYEILSADYEKKVSDYEKQVTEFNQTVAYWNQRQGAPKETYELIKKEQRELELLKAELELDRVEVNNVVTLLNSTAQNDQQIVKKYNSIVESFERRYGGVTLFDRADFDTESINIYEFTDEDVLLLSLVHEFGHYIGLGHVEDTSAIMYYLMQDQNLENPALTDVDIQAFEKMCPTENRVYFGRLKALKNYLQSIL